jgi:hypothetical protein
MSMRSWIAMGVVFILAAPGAATTVRRQLAELPSRVKTVEGFNRCVARDAWWSSDCCRAAHRSCVAECERIHAACADDHDGAIACRSACTEAAGWCERGIGLR